MTHLVTVLTELINAGFKPEGAIKKVSSTLVWKHVEYIDPVFADIDKPKKTGVYARIKNIKNYWLVPKFQLSKLDNDTFNWEISEDKLYWCRQDDWRDPSKIPPIVVEVFPNGYSSIIDGMHRYTIATEKGIKFLPAYVGFNETKE